MKKGFHAVIWREMVRQRKSLYVVIIQVISLLFLYSFYGRNMNAQIIIYLPFALTLISQNDIFYYDKANYIESLLSTPLTIRSILLRKSLFILIKSYILAVSVILLCLLANALIAVGINLGFGTKDLAIILLMPFWQYLLSFLMGAIIWSSGKISKVYIMIIQTFTLGGIYYLLTFGKEYLIIVFLVLTFLPVKIAADRLIMNIDKEKLIKRSI